MLCINIFHKIALSTGFILYPKLVNFSLKSHLNPLYHSLGNLQLGFDPKSSSSPKNEGNSCQSQICALLNVIEENPNMLNLNLLHSASGKIFMNRKQMMVL